MFLLRFLSLFLLPLSLSAKGLACWELEENPQTKEPYTQQNQWSADRSNWQILEPDYPGIIQLARGYFVYQKSKEVALATGNDKAMHCVLGCLISRKVSYQTAVYAAWLKEIKDIEDCNPRTHFEEADFTATIKGADLGLTNTSCITACQGAL